MSCSIARRSLGFRISGLGLRNTCADILKAKESAQSSDIVGAKELSSREESEPKIALHVAAYTKQPAAQTRNGITHILNCSEPRAQRGRLNTSLCSCCGDYC